MPGPSGPATLGPDELGGGFIPPASTTPAAFVPGIAPVTAVPGAPDLVSVALSRIISQYQGKPKLTARILAFVYLMQDYANAIVQMSVLNDPDRASGVNLEVTAALVGQKRVLRGYFVANDPQLRILIALRIVRNRSTGTGPEIIEAMRALLNDGTLIQYFSPGMMYIDLQIARAPSAFEAAAIHDDLLPRPMAVDLLSSWYTPARHFGFDEDLSAGARGFSEEGDDTTGGCFAEII